MPLFMCLSGYSFCVAYYHKDSADNSYSLIVDKVKIQAINIVLLYVIFSAVLYGLKVPLAMFTDGKMTACDAVFNLFFQTY